MSKAPIILHGVTLTPCSEVIAVIRDLNRRFKLGLTNSYLSKIERQIYLSVNCGGKIIAPSIELASSPEISFEILSNLLAFCLSQIGLYLDPIIYEVWYRFQRRSPLVDGVVSLDFRSGAGRHGSDLIEEVFWFLITNPQYLTCNQKLVIPGMRYAKELNEKAIGTIGVQTSGKTVHFQPVEFKKLAGYLIPCIA